MANSKNEIDKDLMYKKLMPSNFRTTRQETPDGEKDAVFTAPVPSPAARSPRTDKKLSPFKPDRRPVAVPSIDSQKTELVNRMEAMVLEKYDSVIARFNCCRCDRCKKDILALALNRLPPRYAVLKEGGLIPDTDSQLNAQVLTALIQAVLQVRAAPRH